MKFKFAFMIAIYKSESKFKYYQGTSVRAVQPD